MFKQEDKQNNERKSILIRKKCFWCGILCFASGMILALENYNVISLFQSVRLIIYMIVIIILPIILFTCASNFWIQEKMKQKIEEQNVADRNKYQ